MDNVPGCFKEIDSTIKTTYFTQDDKTAEDFLVPVLGRTKIYKRETYSFTAGIFSLINDALIEMIKNDCKCYYIVGFELSPAEVKAIEVGYEEDADWFIEKQIISEFGEIDSFIKSLSKWKIDHVTLRLKMLSYLISKGLLHIKVGLKIKNNRVLNPYKHKFHAKIMIFEDFCGHFYVGTGSSNESYGANMNNIESFSVFKSWIPALKDYYEPLILKFDELWNNQSNSIRTVDISNLLKEKIFVNNYESNFVNKNQIIELEEKLNKAIKAEIDDPSENIITSITEEDASIINNDEKNKVDLRWYQTEVIQNWFKEGKQGIFSLCTGAGKTFAAIRAMEQLQTEEERLITIIVCPYISLLEQWVSEIQSSANFNSVQCYENKLNWESKLRTKLSLFKNDKIDKINIITTNKTYSDEYFQNLMEDYWINTLLVIDECHNFGSVTYREVLHGETPFRLGLSATPENEQSREGTSVLYSFFQKNIKPEYELKDGIREGYLSKYSYYPVLCSINPEDNEKYIDILRELSESEKNRDVERIEELLDARAEFLDNSKEKIPMFDRLIDQIDDLSYTLIYCASNVQLKKIEKILMNKDIKYGIITANEKDQRESNIRLFRDGYLDVLLSIRILDEGIDIPAVKNAIILKSSVRTRQSIQRRGRCLRIHRDNSGKKIEKNAKIYDFIVIPKKSSISDSFIKINDAIVRKELERIKDFISLATNSDEATKIIEERLND